MIAPVSFENLTFPDQGLRVWSGFEVEQWKRAGEQFNTTLCQYQTASVRLSTDYGTGIAKWNTSVLAPNGKIYSPPHVRADWGILDTNTDTTSVTGSVNKDNDGSTYDKITNNVFAFGNLGTKIGPVTPSSNGVPANISGPSNRTAPGVQAFVGNDLYSVSVVIAPAGVYKYDIAANSSSRPGTSALRADIGCLGANGKVYFGNGPTTTFLEYDPATNTSTTFGSVTADHYVGAVVPHFDGFIYFFPVNGGTVIKKIDPFTRTVTDTLTVNTDFNYYSGCIGADGRIYLAASNRASVGIYDPRTNTTGSRINLASGDNSFQAITMGSNGDLYLTPWTSRFYHKISLIAGSGAVKQIIQEYNMEGRLAP